MRQDRDIVASILVALLILYSILSPLHTYGSPEEKGSSFVLSSSLLDWPMNYTLKQKTIFNLYHSKSGDFWFTTLSGINHYDGNVIKTYSYFDNGDNAIHGSSVLAITENAYGVIHAVTKDSGILEYKGPDLGFFSIWQGTDTNGSVQQITSTLTDSNGKIWASTLDSALVAYNPTNGSVSGQELQGQHHIVSILPVSDRELGAIDRDGRLLLYQHSGSSRGSVTSIDSCKKFDIVVNSAAFDNNNDLLLGTDKSGIFILSIKHRSCDRLNLPQGYSKQDKPPSIHALLRDSSRPITWVASDSGVFSLSNGEIIQSFSARNSHLKDDWIASITEDNNGVVWVGTFEGINFIVPTIFKVVDAEFEPSASSLVGLATDKEMRLWLATYHGIYIKAEKEGYTRFEELFPANNPVNHRVMSMLVEKDSVWVGYQADGLEQHTLSERSKKVLSTTSDPALSSNSISSVLTFDENRVLVGSYGGGINYLDEFGNVHHRTVGNNKVTRLEKISDDKAWIISESGVYEFCLTSLSIEPISIQVHTDTGVVFPIILSAAMSSSDEVLLGTLNHGLVRVDVSNPNDTRTYKHSLRHSSLATSKTVYAIEIDLEGNFWLSTDHGIEHVNSESNQIKRFSLSHGISGIDFEVGVSHKDAQGLIYFGGNSGYLVFDPEFIRANSKPSRVIISEIVTARESTGFQAPPAGTPLELAHKDYIVSFTFSVLDYLDPANNLYKYKLEGFDPAWIESGTKNTATYTNLPPGEYTLRVQGANSSGVWNTEGVSLSVTVLPPPWRSWWAYCLYTLLALLAIWLAKRMYDAYWIKERALALAQEMYEAADRAEDDLQEQHELQDQLIGSIHAHSLINLELIEEYLQDEDGAYSAPECVAALQCLEQSMYYEAEKLQVDLNGYIDSLIGQLLTRASVAAESITTINSVPDARIPAEVATPIALLAYELLSNCMMHAFEEHSLANYITVGLTTKHESSSLEFAVRDSGRGLPDGFSIASAQSPGFARIHRLCSRLNADLSYQFNNGSHFSISIPLPPDY